MIHVEHASMNIREAGIAAAAEWIRDQSRARGAITVAVSDEAMLRIVSGHGMQADTVIMQLDARQRPVGRYHPTAPAKTIMVDLCAALKAFGWRWLHGEPTD